MCEFTRPPYALNVFPASSKISKPRDFSISLSDKSVALVTLKKADGRDAIILRLINNTPASRSTTLTVGCAVINLDFGKYEVKTLIYENDKLTECDRMII